MIGDSELLSKLRVAGHAYSGATAHVRAIEAQHILNMREAGLIESHRRHEYNLALEAYRESLPGKLSIQGAGDVVRAEEKGGTLRSYQGPYAQYMESIRYQASGPRGNRLVSPCTETEEEWEKRVRAQNGAQPDPEPIATNGN